LVARVVERLSNPPKGDSELSSLSPQERKLLEFIAQGKTNRQIAESMFLAEHTVKNYMTTVLRKLKMSNRTEAAVFATRLMSGPPGSSA
jgi:DNA-binding NarL/FixJ family response regulator